MSLLDLTALLSTPPEIMPLNRGRLQGRPVDTQVVREDMLEGGSKIRFLPFLCQGAEEVVFGGPFCGGAPLALSVMGRLTGLRVTLFFAARKRLHRRQNTAAANGSTLHFVRPGYMTNVQAKARAYAAKAGALFLPLGFDVPEAADPYVAVMEGVRKRVGSPDQVWCAAGSGMLTRCLGVAFPDSEVIGVTVGLRSRHSVQRFTSNVRLVESGYAFARECPARPPFPSCPNYDAKAWQLCERHRRGSVLFWNVLA